MLHETFKERLGDRPLTRKAAALLKEADRLDQELAELRPQISAGRQKRDALIKAYNSPQNTTHVIWFIGGKRTIKRRELQSGNN